MKQSFRGVVEQVRPALPSGEFGVGARKSWRFFGPVLDSAPEQSCIDWAKRLLVAEAALENWRGQSKTSQLWRRFLAQRLSRIKSLLVDGGARRKTARLLLTPLAALLLQTRSSLNLRPPRMKASASKPRESSPRLSASCRSRSEAGAAPLFTFKQKSQKFAPFPFVAPSDGLSSLTNEGKALRSEGTSSSPSLLLAISAAEKLTFHGILGAVRFVASASARLGWLARGSESLPLATLSRSGLLRPPAQVETSFSKQARCKQTPGVQISRLLKQADFFCTPGICLRRAQISAWPLKSS